MPGKLSTIAKGVAGLLLLATAVMLVAMGRDLDGLWHSLGELSPVRLAVLCVLLSAGALLAGLRLQLIAFDLGFSLSFRDSVAALSVGQVAGALAFQLLGQLIGRGALLARRQVPFAGTALMTGYERAAALCASILLAIAGALYLFGSIHVTLGLQAADLIKLGIGVLTATAAGAWLVWGREAADLLRQVTLSHVLRFFRTFLLSLLVQSTTMAAYILCAEITAPGMSIISVAAASALVMFAASIPISFAGFGLREMSAVLALQQVGMGPGEALAVALEIGTLSLLVVGALAAVTAGSVTKSPPSSHIAQPTDPKVTFDHSRVLGWALAMAAATLVFFQVYLPTNNGQINVNLADPVAIVGGLLLVAICISRKQFPRWRAPWMGPALISMTAVMVLSFANGLISFGWTQWAATNKLLGWFVLLAYGATGALAVQLGGERAFERILAVLVVTGAATVAIQLVVLAVTGSELTGLRAEGFAQNANSYAWQMLMVIAALGTTLPKVRFLAVLLALALAGLWLSGSRAGLGAGFVLLWAVCILNRPKREAVINALFVTVILLVGTSIIPIALAATVRGFESIAWLVVPGGVQQPSEVSGGLSLFGGQVGSSLLAVHQESNSDNEHLFSMLEGWKVFLQHPIEGAGLGAFMYNHSTWDNGRGLIIHSTPLWLLAECGVIGAAVFAVPFLCLLARELRMKARDQAGLLIIFICISFAVMSAAHELLYQRTFWLLLGAAAACITSVPDEIDQNCAG